MKVNKLGLLIIAAVLAFGLWAACSAEAKAQSVGIGATFIRTTSPDPSPLVRKDGGANLGAIYVEANAPLPLNLEMRVLGEYSFNAALPTLFTRDEGATRKAIGEFRLRPELRFYFNREGFFHPFVAGGVDYYRQRFKDVDPAPIPGPVPALSYYSHRDAPASGLNPTFTVGSGIGEYGEASFTRLFPDTTILNVSRLEGYRASYNYTHRLSRRLGLKIAGELDYVTFTEASGFGRYERDYYRERDVVFRVRAGVVLK